MPLPLSLPLGLVLGVGLAWSARAELARSDVPLVLSRPFLIALGFALIVYAPTLAYFVVLHGDWAFLYLVHENRIPSAIELACVVLGAMQVPVGLALTTRWAVAKRGIRMFQLSLTLILVLVAACGLAARRLATSASYTQFHGGFGGAPIGQTTLGRGVLLALLAVAVGYAWSAYAVRSPRNA